METFSRVFEEMCNTNRNTQTHSTLTCKCQPPVSFVNCSITATEDEGGVWGSLVGL